MAKVGLVGESILIWRSSRGKVLSINCVSVVVLTWVFLIGDVSVVVSRLGTIGSLVSVNSTESASSFELGIHH